MIDTHKIDDQLTLDLYDQYCWMFLKLWKRKRTQETEPNDYQ